MKIIVQGEAERLDKYISKQKVEISRAMIQKLIEDNQILVNDKPQKASYKVQAGDEIIINIPEVKETDLKSQDIPLDVIYEDDDILVVNKPKGMVVHPAVGNPDGTLVNAVMAHCKGKLSGIGGEFRPGIVHRLDKDTSGLIIVAKNDKAHINLSEQIQNREVKKVYLALVRGVIPENEATINMPIARSTKDRKKMAVDKKGKVAITHFKVLERFEKYTYLEVAIETGCPISAICTLIWCVLPVSMAEIGHPVVGDYTYSNGKNEFNIQGQMLHAKSLEFKHPITGKQMHLEAPLPEYFTEILNRLKQE